MFIETIHSVDSAWLMNLDSFCKKLCEDVDHRARVATRIKLQEDPKGVTAAKMLHDRLEPFFGIIDPTARIEVKIVQLLPTGDGKADLWLDVQLAPTEV